MKKLMMMAAAFGSLLLQVEAASYIDMNVKVTGIKVLDMGLKDRAGNLYTGDATLYLTLGNNTTLEVGTFQIADGEGGGSFSDITQRFKDGEIPAGVAIEAAYFQLVDSDGWTYTSGNGTRTGKDSFPDSIDEDVHDPWLIQYDWVFMGSGATTWNAPENVPEPTSGLLLLLGVAGLALKRKQK